MEDWKQGKVAMADGYRLRAVSLECAFHRLSMGLVVGWTIRPSARPASAHDDAIRHPQRSPSSPTDRTGLGLGQI